MVRKQETTETINVAPVMLNKPPEMYLHNMHAKGTRKPNPDSLDAMTAETDRMVRGQFSNIEHPGQPGTVICKIYKGQPIFKQVFQDGEIAEIPLSVARHINTNCCYDVHGHILDESGNPIKTGKKVHRYKFSSTEYL